MSDIVERLRWAGRKYQHTDIPLGECLREGVNEITALRAEVEKLRAALNLYREAVRIDATMEGPKFMGANSSALKRAWDADLAAMEEKPHE